MLLQANLYHGTIRPGRQNGWILPFSFPTLLDGNPIHPTVNSHRK